MKRASEVPPPVFSSGVTPQRSISTSRTTVRSGPSPVRNGSPPRCQAMLYSSPWRSSIACTSRSSSAALPARVEAEVEHDLADRRGSRCWRRCRHGCCDIWKLDGGNRACRPRIALVPLPRAQLGQRRHGLVDRIARLLRIGHVALDARTVSVRRQRAATADAQQVAQLFLRRRLAGDALVDALAALRGNARPRDARRRWRRPLRPTSAAPPRCPR